MRSAGVFFVLILLFFSLSGWGQLTPPSDYPEHIRQSYSYGILFNSAVSSSWLEEFAAEVIRRTYSPQDQKILLAQLDSMPLSEVEKYATQIFPIDYVEVAESDLKKRGVLEILNNSHSLDEAARSPLRFTRGGKPYVRWFIHPFRDNVDTLLNALGTSKIQRGRFWAQFTESRSTIVFDTHSKEIWSIKLSIPKGTNIKYNKPVTTTFAAVHIQHSEIIAELEKTGQADAQSYQREVQSVGIKIDGHDEAEMARSLSDVSANTIFVSGSALFTKGLQFFLPAGMSKDFEELSEIIENLGRKAGRIAAATGLMHNSNHTQNFGFLINKNTGEVISIFRDPDLEFDFANPAVEKYSKRIRKWLGNVDRGIDFRTNDTMKYEGIGFSSDQHRKFKQLYLQAFQKAFLAFYGYKGPPLPIDADRPFLKTLELNALVAGVSTEQMKKKAAQVKESLEHPYIAEVTAKYSQIIQLQGLGGITEIILSDNLSAKHIEILTSVIRKSGQFPKIWETFLRQTVDQFENNSHIGSAAVDTGLKNFAKLAANLFEPEHLPLLRRFFIVLLAIDKPLHFATFLDYLNHRMDKLNQANRDVQIYDDALNDLSLEVFKYSTSKQRRFFAARLPLHADYIMTLPPPKPLPPFRGSANSIQSCMELFR